MSSSFSTSTLSQGVSSESGLSALCSSGNRPFRINNNGRIRRHKNHGDTCPGSGSFASHVLLSDLPSVRPESDCNRSDVLNSEAPSQLFNSELFQSLFASKERIIKFVPRGARVQFANTLNDAIQVVVSNPEDASAWLRLLYLPRFCLRKPDSSGGSGRRVTLATLVKRQCIAFLDVKNVTSLPQGSWIPKHCCLL